MLAKLFTKSNHITLNVSLKSTVPEIQNRLVQIPVHRSLYMVHIYAHVALGHSVVRICIQNIVWTSKKVYILVPNNNPINERADSPGDIYPGWCPER